mmetsp:Transcript_4621/g.11848  ORF Transcript_4621/g.11848 Transcript_4621/m.11848 type:complete len:84 (-) Transcript_4621:55-306(-)
MPRVRSAQGVESHRLAQFPTCTFSSILDSAMRRNETDCSICMEAYSGEDVLRTLPCFHFYHQQCIDRWLASSQVCPICKFDVQ